MAADIESATKAGDSRGGRATDLLICAALVAGLSVFLGAVNYHYPVNQWLAWRYLGVAALALGWALGCLSFGYFLLSRLGVNSQVSPGRFCPFPSGC